MTILMFYDSIEDIDWIFFCWLNHRFLIERGANVAAVNNDGDLPIDIAESDDMEHLLQEEIDKQGL